MALAGKRPFTFLLFGRNHSPLSSSRVANILPVTMRSCGRCGLALPLETSRTCRAQARAHSRRTQTAQRTVGQCASFPGRELELAEQQLGSSLTCRRPRGAWHFRLVVGWAVHRRVGLSPPGRDSQHPWLPGLTSTPKTAAVFHTWARIPPI